MYQSQDALKEEIIISLCEETGLQKPYETVSIPFQEEDDDEVITQVQLYWNLSEIDLSIPALLEKIIKADIGGYKALVSSVFFVNTDNAILFHLYDDRGADLIAPSTDLLYPIFERFNNWILDYNKEQINNTFTKRP